LTDTEFEKTERGDASLTAPFPNILPDLEKNLGEALSCILETEMKIAFGNLWMEVVCYVFVLGISRIRGLNVLGILMILVPVLSQTTKSSSSLTEQFSN